MKRILFSIFSLLFVLNVFSQVKTDIQGVNDPVFFNTPTTKEYVCSSTNGSNAFENGRGCNAGNSWIAANDLSVPADESFMLKQIKANIFINPGDTFTNIDVFYYADNAGVPGTLLGSQLGMVPTSEVVVGNNFGYDVKDVVLDIMPFTFFGQSGSAKTYWIGLQTTDSSGGLNYWENTTVSAVGHPLAFDDGTGYVIPDATQDGVYTFSGICLTECDHFNPTFNFEGGRGCSPNNGWLVANDLIVNANESYLLEKIIVNIWENTGSSISSVDVVYYDDNAGLPDNQIGFELGVTPTTQSVIGTSIGYDVHEVVLNVTPFSFTGQVALPTTYWVGLSVTNSSGGNNYWESSTNTNVGNMLAFNNNGAGWGIPDPAADGVYIYAGQCQGLGVADATIDGFGMYPNPVENILNLSALNAIDYVGVYNMLGQEVLRASPEATQVEIDMSALSTGSYIVKVQAGHQTASYNLIKQ